MQPFDAIGRKKSDSKVLLGASYSRISLLKQGQNDDGTRKDDGSPEVQKERCFTHAKFLQQKTGAEYRFIEHIFDEGYSGKNLRRPGFQRLWQLIANRQIQFVMGTELSRFSRNVLDFLQVVEHCARHGVAIIIIGLDLDTETPFGRMLVLILVALAQFEREMIAHRVRENALARLLRDGKINGAAEVLGLIRDPNRKGHFIRSEDGIRVAETILKLFLKLSSKKKVLHAAKEMGLTGKGGRELTLRQIEYVIANAETRYRGVWPVNQENADKDPDSLSPERRYQLVKLDHGPVIDLELLDKVVEKVQDTRKKRKRSGAEDWVYLLSHVLTYEDGSGFQGQCAKNRQYRYYHNRSHDLRIRCEEIDQIVVGRLKSYLSDDQEFRKLVVDAIKRRETSLAVLDAEIRRKEKEASDLEANGSEWLNQFLSKVRDPSAGEDQEAISWLNGRVTEMKAQKSRIETQIQALRFQREEVIRRSGLDSLGKAIKEFIDDFDGLTGTQRRNLIEKIVKKVVVRSDNQLELHLFQEPGNLGPGGGGRTRGPKMDLPVPFTVIPQVKSTGRSEFGVTVGG